MMMTDDPIKVYDARWETAEFTAAEIRRLVEATLRYGRLLDVDTVTIARDARLGAGHVMEVAAEEAVRQGFRVFLSAEPISTPQSYFNTLWVSQQHPNTMGLTITASHNPRQYIGMKFTVPVVAAIGLDCGPHGGLTKIRELYHDGEPCPSQPGGSMELIDLTDKYIDYSLEAANLKPGDLDGIGVVIDTFHGSAGPALYRGLRKAGARVVPIRLIPDGNYPTGSPNPTSQGKMARAIEAVHEHGCHVFVGVDGDGDRMVFGDWRGVLTAGFANVPILRACGITPDGPRTPVLYDPKVNPLALVEWTKLGAQPVLFRNGHSQIKDYMSQIDAAAAAEESGHYYHRITLGEHTVSTENSLMTTLMFVGAVKRKPNLLNELWSMQKRVFTTGEFNYQFADDATRDAALKAVLDAFADEGATMQSATADGIDLQGTVITKGVQLDGGESGIALEAGWFSGYLRAATNEKGIVRSYFSADNTRTGERIEEKTRQILESQFGGQVVE